MSTLVLRTIASSLLSLVVVATAFWGGCVSCEQFFMFPGQHLRCCKAGQCERPGKNAPPAPKKDCNRMPLSVRANSHVIPAPSVLPVRIAPPVLVGLPSDASFRAAAAEVVLGHSPPDLQVLHAIFLI